MSTIPALDEDQLETLALFLEDHSEQSEGLDFFGLHGLLAANVVTPSPLDESTLLELVFDTQPQWQDAQQEETILTLIKGLQKEITELIELGQAFPVPCDLNVEADEDDETAPLESWSVGFMLMSLEQPDVWFGHESEAEVAELIFPIAYASGINADEKEFAEIDDDANLSRQVCEAIPDAIIDLFLHFHGEG